MDANFEQTILQSSVDELLASGGDSRCLIVPESKTNRYLCATSPRPRIVQLGSCTASTITQGGYDRAFRVWNRLRAVHGSEHLVTTVEESFRHIRGELRYLLTRGSIQSLHVILTPSGTDAELVPAWLAAQERTRPLCNIVVGPLELGSGTSTAAACRFFDELTPSGARVTPREAVDERLAKLIEVHEISIREASGAVRDSEEIDEEIAAEVAARIADGQRVLLHVTAHSKTGAHAPSLGLMYRLRRQYPDQLDVVVDAAQGRFSRRGLIQTLQLGCMVIVTGSKFFGGPTFAGAVLVPPNCNFARKMVPDVPSGYGHFLARSQLPTSWTMPRTQLPSSANLGLLLRWSASLEEIRNYYATPSPLRLAVLRAFENLVPEILSGSESLELDTVQTPIISDDYERLLQSKTTVFSFQVWDRKNNRRLSQSELRHLFRWMTMDLSRTIQTATAEERRALASCIQIGQPVKLGVAAGEEISVLRIANGGAMITRVAEDVTIGETLEQRIGWLADQLIAAKRKIETAAKYYPHIRTRLEARD